MDFLKDFGVEPVLLLAQIVNFAILLFILKRFLYKPILKVLEERKNKIATSMKQSEQIQKKFEEMEIKQQEILDNARKESTQIVDEAKSEAKTLSSQIQTEASNQADQTLKRVQETLDHEKQKMVSEAKKEIVNVVTLATQKVVGKVMTKRDKDQIVTEVLNETAK